MNLYGMVYNELINSYDVLGLDPSKAPGAASTVGQLAGGSEAPDPEAVEALAKAIAKQETHKPMIEYCGWICCKAGVFKHTEPMKGMSMDDLKKLPDPAGKWARLGLIKGGCSTRNIECPDGWKKVAPYHTHPGEGNFNLTDERKDYPSIAYVAGSDDRKAKKFDRDKLKKLRRENPRQEGESAWDYQKRLREEATTEIGEIPSAPTPENTQPSQ